MEIATSLLQDAAKSHPEQGSKIASFREHLPEIIQKIGTDPPRNLRAPEVVRECISNATLLFRTTLDGEIETWQNDWQSLVGCFMAAVSGLLQRQEISDGVKFVAVKFLEKIILLLADGHAEDAAKILGFMVELLPAKFAVMKTSFSIVTINSLGEIAKRRPEFCGRVLQVLVDLNPDVKSAAHGGHMGSLVYAVKTAFLALLRCPHGGALPWRDRLLGVLRGTYMGEAAEQAIRRANRALREKKRQKKVTSEMTWKGNAAEGKLADVAGEGLAPALQKLTVRNPQVEQEGRREGSCTYVDKAGTGAVHKEDPVRQIIALLEQGEKACESIEIVVGKMDADLLADVVIANMYNLPSRPADLSTVLLNL